MRLSYAEKLRLISALCYAIAANEGSAANKAQYVWLRKKLEKAVRDEREEAMQGPQGTAA